MVPMLSAGYYGSILVDRVLDPVPSEALFWIVPSGSVMLS